MLEYVKTILSKVSFNRELFEKELKKALNMLLPREIHQLKKWCYRRFYTKYPLVLQKVFVK
ncbi:hypothetical protein OO013_11485 [Mangrovivirga sp. M17]|uniref:Uncharacterized protein n=2 Tax=Mangrovivirga TaxID=2858886 RepID=A0A4D7KBU3_9BACT|nr:MULTISPECIES: hypothetical protein [Mangrovivirga]MCX2744492.1 hypothetical protein [Mangrovivirga halotolerans]QCK16978.1 hypothetical protein DCC35_00465 [Mangrovivirga cuniculi]